MQGEPPLQSRMAPPAATNSRLERKLIFISLTTARNTIWNAVAHQLTQSRRIERTFGGSRGSETVNRI